MNNIGSLLLTSVVKCVCSVFQKNLEDSTNDSTEKNEVPLGNSTAGVIFGLVDTITGNIASKKAEEFVIYNSLVRRLKSGDPEDINHDLLNLFKQSAVFAIEFLKKKHLQEIQKYASVNYWSINQQINDYKKEIKSFFKEHQNDIDLFLKKYDFKEIEIIETNSFLEQLVNAVFNGQNELNSGLKAYFIKNLPFCFNLVFTELLKHNDNGFRAFQIWSLKDIREASSKNTEILTKVNEIKVLVQSGKNLITVKDIEFCFDNYCSNILNKLDEIKTEVGKINNYFIIELRKIQFELSEEKKEKEILRNIYLTDKDSYLKEIGVLKEKINAFQGNGFYENNNANIISFQNKIAEYKLLLNQKNDLIDKNEKDIQFLESKYNSRIIRLNDKIEKLQIEIQISKESKQNLEKYRTKVFEEIYEFIELKNITELINADINEPNMSISESAKFFLIKANALASNLQFEYAVQNFEKSIAIFSFYDNLSDYSKFLTNKRNFKKALILSDQCLKVARNIHDEIGIVNQMLHLYYNLYDNNSSKVLGKKYFDNPQLKDVDIKQQVLFYDLLGQNYLANYDINEARICFKSGLTLCESFKSNLLECSLLVNLGDTYFENIFGFKNATTDSINIATKYYKAAYTILPTIEDSESEFKKLNMKVANRLGFLKRGGNNAEALKLISESIEAGKYIYENENIVFPELPINHLLLHLLPIPQNKEHINSNLDLFNYYKSVLSTSVDCSNKQTLFFLFCWEYYISYHSSRSSLRDYLISQLTTSFQEGIEKSSAFFIYKGLNIFKNILITYQNDDSFNGDALIEKINNWLIKLVTINPNSFINFQIEMVLTFADYYLNIGNKEIYITWIEKAESLSKQLDSSFYSTVLKVKINIKIIYYNLAESKFDESKKLSTIIQLLNEVKSFEAEVPLVFECHLDYHLLIYKIGKLFENANFKKEALETFQFGHEKLEKILNNILKLELTNSQHDILIGYVTISLKAIGKLELIFNPEWGIQILQNVMELLKKKLETENYSEMYSVEFCKNGLEIAEYLINHTSTHFTNIIKSVLEIAEIYNKQSDNEWANDIIQNATLMLTTRGIIFGNDKNLSEIDTEGFKIQSLINGIEFSILNARASINFKNDYNTALSQVEDGIVHFENYLSEDGKIKYSNYYFQLTSLRSNIFLHLNNPNEAENSIDKLVFLAKLCYLKNVITDKDFVIGCEHYLPVYKALIAKSNIFNKISLKSKIKKKYLELKEVINKKEIIDSEEENNFDNFLLELVKLL